MKKLIKIKSISDVITNSSTEVFVIKMDERFNAIKNNLECSKYFEFFDDEETVKDYVIKLIEDNNLCIIDNLLRNTVDINDSVDYFIDIITFCLKDLKKTPEEIYDFFKNVFNQLVGYAWVEEEDNCSTDIIDELYYHGYNCVDRC